MRRPLESSHAPFTISGSSDLFWWVSISTLSMVMASLMPSTSLGFTKRRCGVELKFITDAHHSNPDQKLRDNIALANRCYQRLKDGWSYDVIAKEANTSRRRVQQVIELAFLAPDIVRDVTHGTQPLGLTSDWYLQRQRIAAP